MSQVRTLSRPLDAAFVALALVCFALDAAGALDIVLLPLCGRNTIPLTLLAGAVLALLALALRQRSHEPEEHARHRAYLVVALVALALGRLAHAGFATLGLVAVMCLLADYAVQTKRLRVLVACALVLPTTLVSITTALGFADVPLARAAIIRRTSAAEVMRGKLVYVPDWGFIDRSHTHGGHFAFTMAQLTTQSGREGDVRAYVELIDAANDIYVVERRYDVPAIPLTERWAYACAMVLDVAAQAEREQSRAPWRTGFRISAYQSPDLPSNLYGCLEAAGKLSPRVIDRNPRENLRRFRAEQRVFSETRVTEYVLPRGAHAVEREAFDDIERARQRLRPRPLRTFLHPISR